LAALIWLPVPQSNAALETALTRNFPGYDQVFVLVNSTDYGGSDGQFATASARARATEIMVHEIGSWQKSNSPLTPMAWFVRRFCYLPDAFSLPFPCRSVSVFYPCCYCC